MKHTLRIAITMAFFLPAISSLAQVTRLYQNNNIEWGLPLGSIGVMVDSSGALWKTDGTAAGTVKYAAFVRVDTGNALNTPILNSKIYFIGITVANGAELWVTDGTDAGTHIVKDILAGTASSTPRNLTVFNNAVYFFDSTASGVELWKSDGTDAGTGMVSDINPGSASSYDKTYTTLFPNGSTLYFTANDGTHGTELWKTNGTTTSIVKDIRSGSGSSNSTGFAALGSLVIFSANDGSSKGAQAWRSDGTDAGTFVLTSITGPPILGPSPSQFTNLMGKVYFTVFNKTFNAQLLSTDGTVAGTTLVKDFGAGSFVLLSFSVVINGKFYFSAVSGLDWELWYSDGTSSGTKVFKNINPTGSSNAIIMPDILGAAYNNGDYHTRLFNGKIFFSADDGTHGTELWITDGTDAGTTLVKDVNPNSGSSIDSSFSIWMYTTSGLYYVANDGTTGLELWKSDGTSGGTAIVKDVNPGPGSSDPSIFMLANSHIYFTADDNSDGLRDLYIVDQAVALPVTLLNFTASLNGKAAQLQWTTSTEINTKNFVVQRSIDGIHFSSIGTVNAVGNSTQKTAYQFSDAGAINAGANTLYYRLQMVDKDGKFTYSKIATITIVNGKLFVIYPNPVKDQLLITSNASLNNAIIRISDQSGKIVYQQQITNVQAGTPGKINVASLNKGVYYLQLTTGSDVQTIKFMKY